jgi:hypothetical protein
MVKMFVSDSAVRLAREELRSYRVADLRRVDATQASLLTLARRNAFGHQ